MRHIDITLGDQTFRARLLDEMAPDTCQALWDGLPFGGRGVHAQLAGNMMRMYEAAPVGIDKVENGVAFQHPGLIVYFPPLKEIAIAYGDSRFRGAASAVYVTPIAELEGDLDEFAKAAAKLQFEGTKPIQFARAEEAEPGERTEPIPVEGSQIEIDVDGVVTTATLLESYVPRTTAAFKELLPLDGIVINTKWSGEMAHFWVGEAAKRGTVGLVVEPQEKLSRFHFPGYLYYYPEWEGVRIPYGDNAQMSGAFHSIGMTPFARLDGDWSAFKEMASNLLFTGQRPMSIRLKD